jgi:hypothetical protein
MSFLVESRLVESSPASVVASVVKLKITERMTSVVDRQVKLISISIVLVRCCVWKIFRWECSHYCTLAPPQKQTQRHRRRALLFTESTCSVTLLTLLSTACVALRVSAMVIRASSCVSWSSFSASSISVLPISLFPYFSEYSLVGGDTLILDHSLIRPCFISLVAIPRMVRTSTVI